MADRQTHETSWQGIPLSVTYCPDWLNCYLDTYGYPIAHIEAQRRGQAKGLLWPWGRMTGHTGASREWIPPPASRTALMPVPRGCGTASGCRPSARASR